MNKVLITTLSKLIVKEVPSGSLSVFLPHGTWTMVIQEWWAAGQTVNQMKGTQSSARVRCRYAFLEVSSFRSSLFLLATSTSTSTSNSSPNRLSSKSALKVRAIVIARVRCRFFNYSRPHDDRTNLNLNALNLQKIIQHGKALPSCAVLSYPIAIGNPIRFHRHQRQRQRQRQHQRQRQRQRQRCVFQAL